MGDDIRTNGYSTVEGKRADLGRYASLLRQMEDLSIQLLDASPVEQFGQVERAELIQELVASSKVEFEEDTQVVYNIRVA